MINFRTLYKEKMQNFDELKKALKKKYGCKRGLEIFRNSVYEEMESGKLSVKEAAFIFHRYNL